MFTARKQVGRSRCCSLFLLERRHCRCIELSHTEEREITVRSSQLQMRIARRKQKLLGVGGKGQARGKQESVRRKRK
eukprot:761898-Hanusia_phi.AAC.1